jgi:hypothetical protein
MSSPEEEAAGAAAELPGWQLYFLGRHGVLGDVDPDVVLAAAYIFPADYLRREWMAARGGMTPHEALERYLAVCHTWAESHMTGFPGAARLAELGCRVIEASPVVGLPLFAGWRALPLPQGDDDAAIARRCVHICQVLREHRGACHGLALASLQLDPLMAILANPGGGRGEDNAIEYGWQPPFPTPTDADRELRDRVEQLTDDLVAPAYEALTPEEQAEFVTLLNEARKYSTPQ